LQDLVIHVQEFDRVLGIQDRASCHYENSIEKLSVSANLPASVPNLPLSTLMNPDDYHSVTPSLTVTDGQAALDFYIRALDATELFRMAEPGSGKIMHAEFKIGDSRLMLSDEYPAYGSLAPAIGKGGAFMIYLTDVDAAYAKALAAGATVLQEPADQFWGDRTARVADPFGYRWTLATHVRDVSPEEMAKAAAAWSPNKDDS
jgi:PhnB protein